METANRSILERASTPQCAFWGGLRELKRPALGPGATYITGIGLDTAEIQGFLKRPDWGMPACKNE